MFPRSGPAILFTFNIFNILVEKDVVIFIFLAVGEAIDVGQCWDGKENIMALKTVNNTL